MKTSIYEQNGITIVSANTSILQEDVSIFRSRLASLVEDGNIWIVIDLSNATYLSSLGVAAILDAKIKTTQKNGDISLAGVNDLIYNLLTMTNITKKISIFQTIPKAVENLAKLKKSA